MIFSSIIIGGGGFVNGLLTLLLAGVCLGLIYAVGKWFIGKFGLPELVGTCWSGLFLLILLCVVINFVMGMGGHPLFNY
jgi:hypothetical protein